jgi:hypothetical protein
VEVELAYFDSQKAKSSVSSSLQGSSTSPLSMLFSSLGVCLVDQS